jgi:colanic acid biosynthesis protein WcaH
MPRRVDWIPDEEWATIVRNVPIVSVDLLVRTPEGVLLVERTNRPAKGEWFVPGGRVHKGERLVEAVHRVAREELGVEVEIEERLGAYEHLYDDADVDGAGGKHYLANGFLVHTDATEFDLDDQHGAARVFETFPDDLHPYVRGYLEAAGLL